MSKLKNKNNLNGEDPEIVYDDEESSGGSFSSSDPDKKINKLKKDLEKANKDKEEYLQGWQRSKADYINLKKRTEEDKKDFVKYAKEDLILGLLPVVDSFDQAFKNKESWENVSKDWRLGVEFIYSQLKNFLTEHGVTEMNPLGEMFDHNLHHSLEVIEVDDKSDDGKIVDVISKGYKMGDKIIRHANVKVGEFKG